MDNNEIMQKLQELIGTESEMLVLKGRFQNPERFATTKTQEIYYTFMLKTLKSGGDNEYSAGYHTYQIVIPTAISNNYTDDDIKNYKDKEVIVLCSLSGIVKKGETRKYNNISIYAEKIKITKEFSQSNKVQEKSYQL